MYQNPKYKPIPIDPNACPKINYITEEVEQPDLENQDFIESLVVIFYNFDIIQNCKTF
jgi:hypothetical protein